VEEVSSTGLGFSVVYNTRGMTHRGVASEKRIMPEQSKPSEKSKNMGDRSPKSVKKQAAQKQTKESNVIQKKNAADAAKQVAGKKR
jgi:hypothetical protein